MAELPKPKRVLYAPVLKRLMVDRDKEGAMEMLRQMSGSSHGYHMCNFMGHVRERIAKDPQWVNPRCYDEIRGLTINCQDQDDVALIERLLKEGARKIRWAQVVKGMFKTPGLQQRFAAIRVFDPMYYEFEPTDEMHDEKNIYKRCLLKSNHTHEHKTETKQYVYTDAEIDEMVQRASDFCVREDVDWTVRRNSLNMLEALCLLTGRRKWELCKTLQMRSSSASDYQAIVWGITKSLKSGHEERPIPLLAPIANIAAGINKLRRFTHISGKYHQAKSSRQFPKMGHTMFRTIYCEKAFRDRNINKFHPNACSKLWWCSQALCDTLGAYSERYATALVDEPADTSDGDQQLSPSVASSSGGSSEHVFEDLI